MNWRAVVGLESRYEVSDTGLIRSKPSNYTMGKILNSPISLQGYYRFGYNLKGVHKNQPVHRMVAKAFIPNPLSLPQVNHKNGNKLDNNINNLEWCTAKDNINHARKSGLYRDIRGSGKHNSKLKENQVIEIRGKYVPRIYSQSKLALEYAVSRSTIEKIVHGEMWSHV